MLKLKILSLPFLFKLLLLKRVPSQHLLRVHFKLILDMQLMMLAQMVKVPPILLTSFQVIKLKRYQLSHFFQENKVSKFNNLSTQ